MEQSAINTVEMIFASCLWLCAMVGIFKKYFEMIDYRRWRRFFKEHQN